MDPVLWLGSQQQYLDYTSRMESLQAALRAGTLSYAWDDEDEDPQNFTLFGNVAVVDVTGTLTNDDSWWTRWSGDTSYNQIRRGLLEAFQHSEASCCILNLDSGGGTPNGLDDVGALIQQLTSAGFLVYGYTGGYATSACYWLMSACEKRYSGETATLGSIGVITVHLDRTKMYQQAGIKPTVVRSGAKKALGNPMEKLSAEAEQAIQDHSDALHKVFIRRVAEYTGMSEQFVRDNWADGRTWVGQEAKDAGLIHGVSTLDNLIASLQAEFTQRQNGKDTTMKKRTVLTAEQQAALAAGAVIPGLSGATGEENTTPAEASTDPNTPEPATNAESSATPASEPGGSELTNFLRTELSDSRKEAANLTAQLSEANAKIAAFEATHEPMMAVVSGSIRNMQVALTGAAVPTTGMSAQTLLDQHAVLSSTFKAKFPVGGVASLLTDDSDDPQPSAGIPGLMMARTNANKI